jgi:hypothetical protein
LYLDKETCYFIGNESVGFVRSGAVQFYAPQEEFGALGGLQLGAKVRQITPFQLVKYISQKAARQRRPTNLVSRRCERTPNPPRYYL